MGRAGGVEDVLTLEENIVILKSSFLWHKSDSRPSHRHSNTLYNTLNRLLLHPLAHHGEPFLSVPQVVADASGGQRVGEAGHLVEDPTLGHHDEEDGDQREAGEGADDVEGVLG